MTINVNVSSHDLAHAAFVARVTRALVESGLKPQHLCLELTENILMSRVEGALPLLHELKHLGVALAVDDFGTGYSSLSHLSKLPIDSLKIDRSFVARLGGPGGVGADAGAGADASSDAGAAADQDAAVVQSIVLLGRSLGKSVVAEGVETEAQREALLAMGCQRGQGYLLGRPMPAAHWEPILAAARAIGHAANGEGRLENTNATRPHSSPASAARDNLQPEAQPMP